MAYFVRCFCTSSTVPTLGEALEAAGKAHPELKIGAIGEPIAPDSHEWRSALLRYKAGKEPIDVELNVVDGDDSLAAEEIAEFIETVEAEDPSPARQRVLDQADGEGFYDNDQLILSLA